ncbi:hypothetical protein LT493_24460 [Streptomyces tricolor]|nr:hypothetical protein [Streptomyces tricolor]
MVLIPQCGRCGRCGTAAAVTDDAGRDPLAPSRLLDNALRGRMAAEGWRSPPAPRGSTGDRPTPSAATS